MTDPFFVCGYCQIAFTADDNLNERGGEDCPECGEFCGYVGEDD